MNTSIAALQTKNFSGAELEGLVKSAVSFALSKKVDPNNLSKDLDEDNIKITMQDFDKAMEEVQPAFGAALNVLEMCRLRNFMHYICTHNSICIVLMKQFLGD